MTAAENILLSTEETYQTTLSNLKTIAATY